MSPQTGLKKKELFQGTVNFCLSSWPVIKYKLATKTVPIIKENNCFKARPIWFLGPQILDKKILGPARRFINFKSKKTEIWKFWGDLKKIDTSDYILF